MEKLLGENLIIIYFAVGLSIICYGNFRVAQKIMLLYGVTYACCLLDILDSKVAVGMMAVTIFIYLEYLTEDHFKLKLFKKISYKLADACFLMFFQYHFALFLAAVAMQTWRVRGLVAIRPYGEVCVIISLLLLILCINETSIQKFEIHPITDVMKVIEGNPVYRFPYAEIDPAKYRILTELEDKSYFVRKNSYNFLSVEFVRYRLKRFAGYIKGFKGREKLRRTAKAVNHYIVRTKHIRGYSTIEMQLMRNIGLKNGYNCTIRRKLYEFVYSKIFLTSLKAYFTDNFYSNRQHFKEYLLWLYFRVVRTVVRGKAVRPASKAFSSPDMEQWSGEAVFVACMGLSGKGAGYYEAPPYLGILEQEGLDPEKACALYEHFDGKNLE